jgi:two-component system response regulator
MVRMHGLDVLRAIRADARTAHVPVVMHSSSTQQSDVDACYASGASSYLGKSTDYDDLRRKVREAYRFWVDINAPKPD